MRPVPHARAQRAHLPCPSASPSAPTRSPSDALPARLWSAALGRQGNSRAALALAAPTAALCGVVAFNGLQAPLRLFSRSVGSLSTKLLESFRGLNNPFSYGSMQVRLLHPTSNGAPIVAIEGAVYTARGPMEVPDARQPSATKGKHSCGK
jgi:hypothetical protein